MANQKSVAKASSNNVTKSNTKTGKTANGSKEKEKNKKGLIGGIVVGVLVIVAVVVGVVCLISWLTIDYGNTKVLADEANKLRWELDEDDSCYMVTHGNFYMGSGGEDDEFVTVLTNCNNDLLEFEAKVNALSAASGVRLDDEIKEKWEIFKESYDRAFPAWLTILSGANDFYEFLVNLNGITSDSVDSYTREKVDELVKPLLESSNEKMQEYGKRYPANGKIGYGGLFADWLKSETPIPYNSFGNGSAMRVGAVAYFAKTFDELRALSYAVTAVTHNHEEGIKGAEATAVATFMALHGASKEEIKGKKKYHNFKELLMTNDTWEVK